MSSLPHATLHPLRRAYRKVPRSWIDALKARAPRPAWLALRRRVWYRPVPNLGTLSVVIPCYGVEATLAACLESVLSQSYPYLEIIVIIDGSPDNSERIARYYARYDRRISVVVTPNGGLGAARNQGVAIATGTFLTFVDSDDLVPSGSYQRMVGVLTQSQSDFIVGSFQRLQGPKRWTPWWAHQLHATERLGVTLEECPEVLASVFAWNKVFRRAFFNSSVGGFPEGVRYEDQEPSARAYLEAKAFDIIPDVVYTWTLRPGGGSITQGKADLSDLKDRLQTIWTVAHLLRQHASNEVITSWEVKVINLDLPGYINEVPRTDAAYWDVLVGGFAELLEEVLPETWVQVPVHNRVLARLLRDGRRDDLVMAVTRQAEQGKGYVIETNGEAPAARLEYLQELSQVPPRDELLLDRTELKLRSGLTRFEWQADGELLIGGYACLPGIDPETQHYAIRVYLVEGDSGQEIELPVTPANDEIVDRHVNDMVASYASSGYTALIDPRQLLPKSPSEPVPSYHVELEFRHESIVIRDSIETRHQFGTGSLFSHGRLIDGYRITTAWSKRDGLVFSTVRPVVVAEEIILDESSATLRLRCLDDAPIDFVVLAGTRFEGEVRVVPTYMQDGSYTVSLEVSRFPAALSPFKTYSKNVYAMVGGQAVDVHYGSDSAAFREDANLHSNLAIHMGNDGSLRLVQRNATIMATGLVSEGGGEFTVHGVAHLRTQMELDLFLSDGENEWNPITLEYGKDRRSFKARFSSTQTKWDGMASMIGSGGWSLRQRGKEGKRSYWVPVDSVLASRLPVRVWGGSFDLEFTCTRSARALWVRTSPPLGPKDAPRWQQTRLQRSIPNLVRQPSHEGVLFSSFGGRFASGSPLAIADALVRRKADVPLYWAVANGATQHPDGTQPVQVGSSEYYRLLHTTRVLVNNNNFPWYFRKHPDQFYLQTWHGTPLKRIGNDVPSTNLSLSYRQLMQREVGYWDLLLAQNEFAATTLRKAFGYSGDVLTAGYPRNDSLATPMDPEGRRRVLARLGIPNGQKILLYAPTWRDNVRTASNGYALVDYLDGGYVSKELGGNWTVLVRGHSNTSGAVAGTSSNVLNVSDYPDINDLIHISDALVTDYSSVMFDFAVTGRPILFLVPDLEEYGSETRGFYFDLSSEAPGPLLRTSADVVDQLRTIDLGVEGGAQYRRFRERYTSLDDGHAVDRVLDHVWSSWSLGGAGAGAV